MTRSQIRKYAFIKSIPIMCSYIFVSMAYGIMMEEAGFNNILQEFSHPLQVVR